MVSSAYICYDSRLHAVNLKFIAELIESETQWPVSNTEWKGFGLVIPQWLAHTPIPFLIQLENDPAWVLQENLEFGERAGLSKDNEIFTQLAKCDARLAIQSKTPDQVVIGG